MTIKQKQTQLKYLGFYLGEIDGSFGPKSISGTKSFQKTYGLVADGSFGPATETKTIQVWKDVQTKLNVRGYNLAVDGSCGPATQQAIKQFQKDYLLGIDGSCGPITRSYIDAWAYAKHFKLSEFRCPRECNGYPVNVQPTLLYVCEDIRNHFGRSFNITSGIRCKSFNNSLNGSVTNSPHVTGKAVDFNISGINKNIVLAYCQQLVRQGKLQYTYTNSTNMAGAVHINV